MMQPEQKFKQFLRYKLWGHVQFIESPTTGSGIPDINICHRGQEVWLEAKCIYGNRIELKKFQLAWHVQRATVGGCCWFVLRPHDARGFPVHLIHGSLAPDLWRYSTSIKTMLDLQPVHPGLIHLDVRGERKLNEFLFKI